MKKNYCTICEEQFHSADTFSFHMRRHGEITETMIEPEAMEFIPHVEINPETGQAKPKPFKQKPYEQLTDYGG